MNQYNLRPLWDAILDVYQEVAKLCDKEGICYFVGYGSALGAVRHGGFIPWDDDMDLVMPIHDYKRFVEIADSKLPAHLGLVTNRNTPGFYYNYVKVSDMRRERVFEVSDASGHPVAGGIDIDIFPVSAVPPQTVRRKIWSAMLKMRRSFILGKEFPTLKSKLGWLGGALLGGIMFKYSSAKSFEQLCDMEQAQNPCDKAKNMGVYDIQRCRHVECVPASCYSSVARMKFEGLDVPIPGDYDLYLRSLYGDYMTPVRPKENEFSHGRVEPQAWRFGPTNRGAK